MVEIEKIQRTLASNGIDGWLMLTVSHRNTVMDNLLKLDEVHVQSRRCGYWIPANGDPKKIVHKIEQGIMDHLPGERYEYSGWREYEKTLRKMLSGMNKVAMEYSPGNAVPAVALVDAGSVELVRSLGVEVATSATLVQAFTATWSKKQVEMHQEASACLYDCVQETFKEIARRVKEQGSADEYEIQQFMGEFIKAQGMVASHPTIVAVNEHSADPHYMPSATQSSKIKEGDFVLIDLWCKKAGDPRAVYGDITWTGYVGDVVPEKYEEVFRIVASARDAAIAAIKKAWKEEVQIKGAEIDDVCRAVIERAGFGEYFVHRTGHSIHTEIHGPGANIDNLETRDERVLIPRTCFSIEPGVYLPGKFGVRSEVDVYLDPKQGVEIFGTGRQKAIIPMYSLLTQE